VTATVDVHPLDLPARETLGFLDRALPPGSRVLEIGCGDGRVAAGLAAKGLVVTAIDHSAAAVAEARSRGVPAQEADFLAYHQGPYDAMLFTRSLHHLNPLGAALDRAVELLVPRGLVICEEFAHERMDEPTAAWLAEAFLAHRSRLVIDDQDVPPRDAPLAWWRAYHGGFEGLHTGAALEAAIAERATVIHASDAPYLYRSLCRALPAGELALATAKALLADERAAVAERRIRPLGMRLIARRSE
jgi:SAM-dependent methyltransferase